MAFTATKDAQHALAAPLRSARSYEEVFGIERVTAPNFGFPVYWLRLGVKAMTAFNYRFDHAQGFRTVLVSEQYHPCWQHWWPHGHMIGWEDNFVHELLHLLTCIREDAPIGPRGATLEDGYRCAEVCDALVRSHETGQRQRLECRPL